VNRLVVAVYEHDDRDLGALLHRGDQLGGGEEERAVADHDHHLAGVGLRESNPHAGRQLVTHAREAELEMRARAGRNLPEFEQVAGRAAAAATTQSPAQAAPLSARNT
jgi:hypothetical protein